MVVISKPTSTQINERTNQALRVMGDRNDEVNLNKFTWTASNSYVSAESNGSSERVTASVAW